MQTVVNWRRLGKTACAGAIFACTALALPSSSALAYSIFNFYVSNIDSKPVTITLRAGNCYNGSMPDGERTKLPPGGFMVITVKRDQGSNCDGEAGVFNLEFDPPDADGRKTARFEFSNDGGMWLGNIANKYPGTLSPRNQVGNYVYTTVPSVVTPAVTPIGKAKGYWSFVGQGLVDQTVKYEVTNQTSTDKTVSNETKQSIAAALEAGVEAGPFSVKATLTATEERTVGHSMSIGLMNSITQSTEIKIAMTNTEMNEANVFAIWQWVAEVPMSDGSRMLIKTSMITGTPDANPPTYLPGSPEDIASLKPRSEKNLPVPASVSTLGAVSPAVAPPAVAPPAATVPRIANVLNGTYAYGAADERPTNFRLTLSAINATNTTFTGVIQENPSGFGVAASDGFLWADVVGSVLSVGGKTMVRFQKQYKFFSSPVVTCECQMDPTTGNLAGVWSNAPGVVGGNVGLAPAK